VHFVAVVLHARVRERRGSFAGCRLAIGVLRACA
jgi:hypothetical protein